MRYTLFAIIIFLSTPSFAFDFHGIKSGMTESQVSSALKKLGVSDPDSSYASLGDNGISGVKPSPRRLSFGYDHEGKLYQMNIDYVFISEGLTGPQTVAFKAVLEEKYKALIKDDKYGYEAILIDQKMLDKLISHHKSVFLKTM